MLPVVLAGFIGGRLAYVVGWEPELFWREPLGILAVEIAFGLSLLQGASLALLAVALVAFGRRLTARKALT
jgi:prolipoprotein diacylglyceryltransferase